MKKIFVIDWLLAFAFVATTLSGFALHFAGHFSSHEVWHNWAVCHILASTAFIIFGGMHVHTHWGWYKGLISKGLGNRSRITAGLSLFFLAATITGLALLSVDGANSGIGLWHYRVGILLTVIGIAHFAARFPILRKSIN